MLIDGLDDIFGSYVLNAQPSSDFSYEGAMNKLANLELSADEGSNIIFTTPGDELATDPYGNGDYGLTGRQGRLLRLAGWIDLDSKLTVCFGAFIYISANHYIGRMCWSRTWIPSQTKICRLPSQRSSCTVRLPSPHNRNVYAFRHDVRQCRYSGISPDYTIRKPPQ